MIKIDDLKNIKGIGPKAIERIEKYLDEKYGERDKPNSYIGEMNFDLNEIYLGDALKLLKEIPDNSIDIIITSPPYNIGSMKSNHIQYGTYAGNDMEEHLYQRWQLDFLDECFRVLKLDGSMFYNHKVRIKDGEAIHPMEWLLESNFVLKQEITWNMAKSANTDKIRFFPFSERVYWLTKCSSTKLYNEMNLSDVWRVVPTNNRKDTGHIAVMPDEIVSNILSAVKGDIVLDPFAGTGTTLRVAKSAGRDYIGFEIDEGYYEIAKERLDD